MYKDVSITPILSLGVFLMVVLIWLVLYWRRLHLYRILTSKHRQIQTVYEIDYGLADPTEDQVVLFERQGLFWRHDAIRAEAFDQLSQGALNGGACERSYVPAHKQGGTIAYDHLHAVAPQLIAFYLSDELRFFVSRLVGEAVVPTPIRDQSSCSILRYTQPKDRIGWHFDHNFYKGRHFTVLLVVLNEHNADSTVLSSCHFQARLSDGIFQLDDKPGTLVVFEGARLQHRATALEPDETRVLYSMTMSTSQQAYHWQALARRLKDTAFYGIRALWT